MNPHFGHVAAALEADIRAHGGVIRSGSPVESLHQLRGTRAVLLDVAPRGLLNIGGDQLRLRHLPDGKHGNVSDIHDDVDRHDRDDAYRYPQ